MAAALLTRRVFLRLRSPPTSRPLRGAFSTSNFLRRAAKQAKAAAASAKAVSRSSPASAVSYLPFASSLALRSHPTLLYTAPSHRAYILFSYGAAIFCFSYAAYNLNAHYYNPPPGLSSWVPIAFGVVCFLVTCVGGWLILGPTRLVKTITALPTPAPVPGRPGLLRIEVELRKVFPIPFIPARRVVATSDEMTFSRRLSAPRMSAAERLEAEKQEYRMKALDSEKSILTLPFRQLNVLFYNLFKAAARVWSREGFLELSIRGKVYKLDVTGGWALDEGRALDRLVRVRA